MSKASDIKFVFVKVTPQMAREWLAIEPHFTPRTIRQRNVGKILHAVNEGDWKPNHHAIALAPDGSVLDGRHRLTAIGSQRKHVYTWVAYDCDPNTFDTMDGGASRSPGDTLKTAGFNDVNVLSAATRQVIAYPEIIGTPSTLGSITGQMTNTDIRNALEDPSIGKSVQEALRPGHVISKGIGRYGTRTSATVLTSVISLYTAQSEDLQEEFASRLGDGLHLDVGSPILAMRNWLLQPGGYQKTTGTYRPTAFLYCGLKCWNDYVNGEERHNVRYRPSRDIMPEVV